jgi:hypothetical protein
MTVRDLVQKILLESPDLDATVYIGKQIDEFEVKSYEVENISSEGSNDSLVITIKDWQP